MAIARRSEQKRSWVLCQVCALASACFGAFVLLGWAFDIPSLKSLVPGLVPVKANTGLCFVLAGLAICANSRMSIERPFCSRIARAFSVLLTLISVVTALEYALGVSLGVDELLAKESHNAPETLNPGRMSLPATLNFLLLGTALLLADCGALRRLIRSMIGCVLLLSSLVFIGYLYGLDALTSFGPFTPMAVPTSIAFLFLCSGALLAYPSLQPEQASLPMFGMTLSFVLTLLLLVMIGGGALVSGRSAIVELKNPHPGELKDLLTEVRFISQHMTSDVRAYLLTGSPALLDPCEQALEQLRLIQTNLDNLTAGDPNGQSPIHSLSPQIRHIVEFHSMLIALMKVGNVSQARSAFESDDGTQLMQDLRQRIDRMIQYETGIELANQKRATLAVTKATASMITGLVLAICILIGTAVVLRREINIRKKLLDERNSMFELSVDMVCVAGLDGYFKELNPSFERILGWTSEELYAKPFVEFIHPDDHAATYAAMTQLNNRKPVRSFENRYTCKDGSIKWLSWGASPLFQKGLVFAIARDITERRLMEERLLALNNELQQHAALLISANEELDDFSASVSHDLRAPLRHIDSFVELLKEHSAQRLDDKDKRYIEIVQESLKQMGGLIDELLAFSRTSRMEMSAGLVSLGDLVRESVKELTDEHPSRDIRWTVGELPSVTGDRILIKQAVFNLLANAVKYTRYRETATIDVGLATTTRPGASGQVVVSIRDNGAGFNMEFADKLFGVFQRLHQASEFEGTGIGLANVRRIVTRHGGYTWAEGRTGQGATFYFSLPSSPVFSPSNPS